MKRLVSVLLLLLALPVVNVNRLEWLLDRWFAPAVLVAAIGCLIATILSAVDATVRGFRRPPSMHEVIPPTNQRIA